jgi:hypothetical protein
MKGERMDTEVLPRMNGDQLEGSSREAADLYVHC